MNIFEKQHCECGKKGCYFCWLKGRAYNATVGITQHEEMDINDILQKVSTVSGVTIKQIAGQSRKEKVRIARQVFCYMARRKERFPGEPVWTLKQIGKAVNRQHATVIHAAGVVETMMGLREPRYTAIGRRLGLI